MSVIEIVQPGPWLAINDRSHWQVRAKRTRVWRGAACIHAQDQHVEPIVGPVQVLATIHKPTRVKYDLDGITATIKACIDGIRDAGVIEADDSSVMVRLITERGEVGKPGRVVLTITPATPTLPPYARGTTTRSAR